MYFILMPMQINKPTHTIQQQQDLNKKSTKVERKLKGVANRIGTITLSSFGN